ncbi:aminoglycoside phosphotransferase family protein [sulfur-oxidizing endosymbiont of Gigantopelta aegis]|uniref:aminoglycoside phosphotransferase family protein n=1 Tax=sulfur-oxidizing endosymbiont of Gigantopelta aegis TaxID=2794934 RepID=UPI0018DC9D8F|nr:phosphotransferase [sulfur-oxidizing endosymbiont of Gigantopelta aegis]
MPLRIKQIKQWLENELQAELQSFAPASNDASFRRYFRVSFKQAVLKMPVDQSFVVMDAPPEKESLTEFISIASSLEKTGINVPHLYAVNEADGFILMSDLGNTAYLSLLDSSLNNAPDFAQADKLYSDAMSALVLMQVGMQESGTERKSLALPEYDAQRLRAEMDLLPQWYIKVHCQQDLDASQQAMLDNTMAVLIHSAQEQPQVFVHRDYHSRNLMFLAAHNPGVIDFQDAVIGPITYDLVSLLRDSYIAWPEEKVYAWVEQYRQILLSKGLLVKDDKAQFIRWFDWMGIQRQLKVVGIFCRLNYRDGKSNYLNDIPQTLNYLFSVCARYPEFADLLQLLQSLEHSSGSANSTEKVSSA